MANYFGIKTLVTAIKKGSKFEDYHRNDGSDEIMAQDECTGDIIQLKWGQEVPYGTRILAGEPCYNTTDRRIVYLQIGSFVGINKPLKTALTYRILRNNDHFKFFLKGKKPFLDDPDYNNYDPPPDNEPVTYPDPESDLPTYDDEAGDDDMDDPTDPPTGEGSDCDGTIGIAA
jgi:hypothetical protein